MSSRLLIKEFRKLSLKILRPKLEILVLEVSFSNFTLCLSWETKHVGDLEQPRWSEEEIFESGVSVQETSKRFSGIIQKIKVLDARL
jgi:hypothetical protein